MAGNFVTIAKLLMFAGTGLLLLGLMLWIAPGLLAWFGRLPGDVRIEIASGRIVIPITSMIIVSLLGSILFNLFWRG